MPGIADNSNLLGRIDPSMLIGNAPGVSTSAVTALSDAMRQGQVSADDVIQRYGEHAKLKQSIDDQLLKEAGSPEAVAQRQSATQAATLQNQNAIANAPLTGEAQKDSLLASIFKAQAQPGNYEAKIDALNKAGATLTNPPQLESGLTPEQRSEIDDKFGSVQRWGMQQSQAAAYVQASKEVPVKSTDKYGNEQTITKIRDPFGQEVDPQKYRDIAMFAASPYSIWKAHGEPLFSTVLAPGQSTVNEPQVTPSQPAPTVTPMVTPSAGAGGAPSRADFLSPSVAPKTASIVKPSVLPPQSQIVTETKAMPVPKPAEITEGFRKLDTYKEWEKARPYAESMMDAAAAYDKPPTPAELKRFGGPNLNARDMELAESVMKLYDPAGVVRSFKWDKITEAQPWADKLDNLVPMLAKNGTLTPDTRQALITIGTDNIRGREKSLAPYLNQAKQVAEDSGYGDQLHRVFTSQELSILNGSGITPPYVEKGATPQPQGASASNPITLSSGKKVYRDASGKMVVVGP